MLKYATQIVASKQNVGKQNKSEHIIDVEKFQISPYLSCGEISPPDRCGEFQISLHPCSGEI